MKLCGQPRAPTPGLVALARGPGGNLTRAIAVLVMPLAEATRMPWRRRMSMRRVVITGASAGLGRAAAREFGKRGDAVGLIARDGERLADAKAEIEAAGGRAVALPADVADAGAVREAADRAARELGGIDIWVNCAMATVFAPFDEMTPEEYRRVTE